MHKLLFRRWRRSASSPADLRFVNLSENVTFRATDRRDGSAFVLRLHRPWYHDIAALRSEHLWTRALIQAGIAAPESLLTQAGENFARVEVTANRGTALGWPRALGGRRTARRRGCA